MRTHSIAAIPADGIGPEVISAGIRVLEALAKRSGDLAFNVKTFDWGSDYYKKHGIMMPADGLTELKKFDAIYFGAVGAPDVPDHITLWGLRLPICQGFDQYANVRPTKILPGVASPLRNVGVGDLDWVIVRENSEGEYAGMGGRAHRGLPEEVGTEVAVFTRVGVTRIMRYAFQLAQSRPRKFLTVVTKSNAQRHGMVMWDEIAAEVAAEFPDVTWDKMLVDAMTVRMTLHPKSLDTIVATNLHADILSDLAGALAGSLGVAPTGNIDPQRRFPSMFEPIHGSAFDITGKGIANPVATFWTGAQMLEHLGEKDAAIRLMSAVERVCAAGVLTPDVRRQGDDEGSHGRRDRRDPRDERVIATRRHGRACPGHDELWINYFRPCGGGAAIAATGSGGVRWRGTMMDWPGVRVAFSASELLCASVHSGTRRAAAMLSMVSPARTGTRTPLSHNSTGVFGGTR
ncbi:tartrate dehydrogenase/decarboxylase/D-malate dehydrogenase [Bradyrhizobium sp. i1.4.4]